jgi:hypothetical protein
MTAQLALALGRWQPVAAPATLAGYRQLLVDQVLVDLAGRPLVARPCPHCPTSTVGETCPQSLHCPSCAAAPDKPCRRPSEHALGAAFAGWHAKRTAAAELADDQRQAHGDPTLPAPWPPRRSARRRPPP